MGFKFGYFLSGATSQIEETVEAATKSNAAEIAGRVKTAAEVFVEQQKQAQKTREELKSTINGLSSVTWNDGKTFDDQQLIALASNPDAAKTILEQIKKDPSLTSRVSRDFVKALNNVPVNTTPQEYIDSLFKTVRKSEEDVKKMFEPTGSFLDRIASKRNYEVAQKTVSKYGLTLDQVFGTTTNVAKDIQRKVEVNFAAFSKAPEFKNLLDSAKIDLAKAQETGDTEAVKKASDALQRLVLIEDTGKLVNKTEPQIQTELVTEIVNARRAGNEQKASDLEAVLKQRQALKAGESPEKVSQTNLITIASRNLTSVMERRLPPGSYITVVNPDQTTDIKLKDFKQERVYFEARKESDDLIIKMFTDDKGVVKSEFHKNALFSRGINVDPETNKPIAPVYTTLEAMKNKDEAAAAAAAARRPGQAPAAPAAAPAAAPQRSSMAPTGEVATPPLASSAAPQQRPATGSAREMRGTVGGGTQINTNTPEWNKFKEDLKASGLPAEAQQQVINDAIKAGVTAPRWTGARQQQQAAPARQPQTTQTKPPKIAGRYNRETGEWE